MLLPSIFGENLLDDWMDFPRLDFADADRKLYGKHAPNLMKTDVQEQEDGYEMAIDLPGFKKDDLSLSLDQGYLSISATKSLNNDEKDKKGKILRQERYAGSMQRSFYVGEAITEEDIHARFEDGVLRLSIPKKDAKSVPEKKHIAIEG